MSKLSFYLAFTSASSFTLYGRGGKILGRTSHNDFLRTQAIRLPDDGATRAEWVKQIYAACDVTTLPVPHILHEDDSKPKGEQVKHADLNKSDDLTYLDESRNSDPDFIKGVQKAITKLIAEYGRLTRLQLMEFTEYGEGTIDQALEHNSFAIDENGLVAIIQKPVKKEVGKKKAK